MKRFPAGEPFQKILTWINLMALKHSRRTGEGRAVWHTERLWELTRDLPVRTVPLDSIAEFDQNCWFDAERPPTCRAVARHVGRINEADLSYPIILSADGRLMDGGHRIAKAWLLELAEIQAVQFAEDPAPDYVLPESAMP